MSVSTLGSIIEEYLIEIGVTDSAEEESGRRTHELEPALCDTETSRDWNDASMPCGASRSTTS